MWEIFFFISVLSISIFFLYKFRMKKFGNVSDLVIPLFLEINNLKINNKLKISIEKERNIAFLFMLYNFLNRIKWKKMTPRVLDLVMVKFVRFILKKNQNRKN